MNKNMYVMIGGGIKMLSDILELMDVMEIEIFSMPREIIDSYYECKDN